MDVTCIVDMKSKGIQARDYFLAVNIFGKRLMNTAAALHTAAH